MRNTQKKDSLGNPIFEKDIIMYTNGRGVRRGIVEQDGYYWVVKEIGVEYTDKFLPLHLHEWLLPNRCYNLGTSQNKAILDFLCQKQ